MLIDNEYDHNVFPPLRSSFPLVSVQVCPNEVDCSYPLELLQSRRITTDWGTIRRCAHKPNVILEELWLDN
jgi:hypothetical protein